MSTPPPSSSSPLPTPPTSSSTSSPQLTSSPLSSSPLTTTTPPALSPRDSSSSASSGTSTVRVSSPLNPGSSPRLSTLNLSFPSGSSGQPSPTGSSGDERSRRISLTTLGRRVLGGRGASPSPARSVGHGGSLPAPLGHSMSSPGPTTGTVHSSPALSATHSSPGPSTVHHEHDTPTLTITRGEDGGSRISLPDDLSTLSGDVLMHSFTRSRSSSRERSGSQSKSRSRDPSPSGHGLGLMSPRKAAGTQTPPNAAPRTWWGSGSSDHGGHSVKKGRWTEEEEGVRVSVRKRILLAALATLDTTKDLTHEALTLGVDILDLAPVPGLASVARLVLGVWDAVEQVDMNKLACLRLAERCADILLSVRMEVHDAGDVVSEEVRVPLERLEESITQVLRFLQTNNRRPLLKRYLKRDEIQREITGLDNGLRDALGMFGLSVQIRILKQVQEAERRRERDVREILEKLMQQQQQQQVVQGGMDMGTEQAEGSKGNALHLTLDPMPPLVDMLEWSSPHDIASPTPLPTPAFPMPHSGPPTAEQISEALNHVHSLQNNEDMERDTERLREFLRSVMQGSDVDVVDAMGIGKGEMVEAVKTLQRALEREREKELASLSLPTTEEEPEMEEQEGKPGIIRRMSLKRANTNGSSREEGRDVKRSKTLDSTASSSSTNGSGGKAGGGGGVMVRKDTLDREFMETSIDALRRMSRGAGMDMGDLPAWTITRYEVDRDLKIGIGFFSDVYRGTWRGKTVAIKVLDSAAPRDLFKREVEIWKPLKHANVLELYGASSTAGDPPWYFVSPYLKNGSLVKYLRRVEGEVGMDVVSGVSEGLMVGGVGGMGMGVGMGGRGRQATFPVWSVTQNAGTLVGGRTRTISSGKGETDIHREWDLWRFMHEIAKGMQYLHGHGVMHGDLKATNVLVDDKLRCVITDFGQSEMKSEAYRLSGKGQPHGTLRWQAPELMVGHTRLTAEMDVYAFAICCVEILTLGRMPWPLSDDDDVRRFVLKDNSRPALPATRFNTPTLQDLLRRCWDSEPKERPPFAVIVKELKAMRKSMGSNPEEGVSPRLPLLRELAEEENYSHTASPDMRPDPLPDMDGLDTLFGSPPNATVELPGIAPPTSKGSHSEDVVTNDAPGMPIPAVYTSSTESSRSSTINSTSFNESPVSAREHDLALQRWQSPIPQDERITMQRNERKYRLLLEHNFHQSLTLPLWSPSPVELGAVGYLSKPEGAFITLFNAFSPHAASHPGICTLPSVYGYGHVRKGNQKVDRRTLAQRGVEKIAGWLTIKNKGDGVTSQTVTRRYTFPLKAGHKVAVLYTELTDYRYVESLDAPKRWFKTHADPIMQIYGAKYQIQKEDLLFVIGTLQTPNYALFVSHSHPDGHAHFNVFASPKKDHPWGTFTTDSVMQEAAGPSYKDRADATRVSACKISNSSGQWDSVLLARLRFKPDVLEPTSL